MKQLRMIKSALSDIPSANIPDGFTLRLINPDEKSKWEALCNKAFDSTEFDFDNYNTTHPGYVEDGVFVIVHKSSDSDEEVFVATGTALCNYDRDDGYGNIHMIAADPDFAGKKLGYEITTAVMRRLRDGGFKGIDLHTQDFRLAAIKTYLTLGFEPDLTDEDKSMPLRWECIQKALAHRNDKISQLILSAEQGDAEAQFKLSEYYHDRKNFEQTIHWVTKAAEQGHMQAQKELGDYYSDGEIVTSDNKLAVKWLTKAAKQGHGPAQYNLACYYRHVEDNEKNRKSAVRWYRCAAKLGLAYAQYQLALCYKEGIGVTHNIKQAAKWWRAAGNQDSYSYLQQNEVNLSRHYLGNYYYGAYGGVPNYKKAVSWYKWAADMGDSDAEKMLDLVNQIIETSIKPTKS